MPTKPAANMPKINSRGLINCPPMNNGGSVAKICGPTCKPLTKNMPIKTAAMVEPGMPNVSKGIIDGPDTALFADSGAAMPSTTPVPHLSLFLALRFSSPYATKQATEEPRPGIIPINEPMIDERNISGRQRLNSAQVKYCAVGSSMPSALMSIIFTFADFSA